METIEYVIDQDTSLYFTPKNNGKAEYWIELHDFANLDYVKEEVTYNLLQTIIDNPHRFLAKYRHHY